MPKPEGQLDPNYCKPSSRASDNLLQGRQVGLLISPNPRELMPQVKKQEMRKAILDAAYALFRKQGYYETTLRQIASRAHTSLANVYVYFDSKYEIVFELYDPWMAAKIDQLEHDANAIVDPHQRLRHILSTLWAEIPAANNGFARNIMQALSIASTAKEYDPKMVSWIEAKLTKLLMSSLPPDRRSFAANGALAHVLIMAFDGFVINQCLNPAAACNEDVLDVVCTSLLGFSTGAATARAKPRNAETLLASRTSSNTKSDRR
jgi:AcrR family transcriptional regulator